MTFRAEKILIIEDEAIVAMSLKKLVLSCGYEVTGTVTNYSDAIGVAKENCPDLVIADIKIKGEKDGIITACEIKKLCASSVIFLTAYNDEETFKRCMALSPSGYISKPFRENELLKTIGEAVKKRAVKAGSVNPGENYRSESP